MNGRIKELAEQAGMVRGGYANTPEKIMTWREHFDNPGSLEKFAELIVKECCSTLQGFTFEEIAVKAIKNTFGVEE